MWLAMSICTTEQVTEFLGGIWSSNRRHRRSLGVLLRDAVLPVCCRVWCGTQSSIHLRRHMLVGEDSLVVPMQVKLLGGGVVVDFLDAAAGECLGGHVSRHQCACDVLSLPNCGWHQGRHGCLEDGRWLEDETGAIKKAVPP